MQEFNGYEYLAIDIANNFGLDRLTWDDRLNWFNDNSSKLEGMIDKAKNPLLFEKGIKNYDQAINGEGIGYPMALDSTASGLQCLALMSGCAKTAYNVNLINTGKREDIYTKVANGMSQLTGKTFTRDVLKKPIMTLFYGSTAKPKEIFGKDTPELKVFYLIMDQELTGAMQLMSIMQACWDDEALEYNWTLPDGFKVNMKVMDTIDKRIEVDELDHATFTQRMKVNQPKEGGLSLAANITHSVDAYICREMIRRADIQGFELATIHDSFHFHPNYGNLLRKNYMDIMREIADMDIFTNIIREVINDNTFIYNKLSNNLSTLLDGEYALS